MTRFRFLILLCVCGLLAGWGAWSWADEAPSKDKPPPVREIYMQPFGVQDEPPETGWTQAVGMAEKIDAWEKETGINLPPDYRAFMVAFNGGYPWPNFISIDAVPDEVYPSEGRDAIIGSFNDFGNVGLLWDAGRADQVIPPNMLWIASSSLNLKFLLSVDKATYGQVFAWSHFYAPWGTDKNNRIYPVAPSFNDFLRGLHNRDDDDDSEFSFWKFKPLKPFIRAYQIPD